ncbi:hypothetical protein [Streptomyces sp. NPDC048669]|uniref:hypothetical protein n=1 Tax=Streptomyces sp. NPDC048669 TaxID=3155267 RepID=UPI0034230488
MLLLISPDGVEEALGCAKAAEQDRRAREHAASAPVTAPAAVPAAVPAAAPVAAS